MKKRQLEKAIKNKLLPRIGINGNKDLITESILKKQKPPKLTWREKKCLLKFCITIISASRQAMANAYEDVLGEDFMGPYGCSEGEAKEIMNWNVR